MATENRIFLAHAREDKPQVRKLYDELKELGFDPWLDEIDLLPGQIWREEIPKAIETATICLACLSKHSIAKQGYVQREFRYAMSAYAERPPNSIYLIPVRLDDCDIPDLQLPGLGLNLQDLQWVDLFREDGLKRIVGAVELNVKPERKSKPRKKPHPKLEAIAPQPKQAKFASQQKIKLFETFRDIDATWCPSMVLLPVGKFLMGSPETEKLRYGNEGPQHEVTISRSFALGRFAVTFREYDHFCDQTGRDIPKDEGWGRGRCPVINVSYNDAEAYCAWLSKVTKAIYQLPSEAMWEYACRAGTTTAYAFGNDLAPDQANFGYNVDQTSQVDAYPPNSWGFYNMHGNVWEWCQDKFHPDYEGAPEDESAWLSPIAETRVMRGGTWVHDARTARSACRGQLAPEKRADNIGFRCARTQAS